MSKVPYPCTNAHAGVCDPGESDADGSPGDLVSMMERNALNKRQLEATLSEYEAENGKLSDDLATCTRRLDKSESTRQKLESDLKHANGNNDVIIGGFRV